MGLVLVFGVLYWLATNKLRYGILHLVRQLLALAVPIGFIMGNLGDAMKIGASLQVICLGAIAPGGTLPADEVLVPCTTIPVALAVGLEPDIAVTIAAPVGLLGALLDNLKRTYYSYSVHLADKAAEKGDMKTMGKAGFRYPFFCPISLYALSITLALLFGIDAASAFLNATPARTMNGLSAADDLLPALGFAVTIMVTGKKELIPYFILGSAMYARTGTNTIGIAVIAIRTVVLQLQSTNSIGSTAAVDDDKGDF